MFFGLTNSPATFQTMMNAIFTQEIAKGWLIIYMDDTVTQKLSQCLSILESLTWHKSHKLDNILKIIYIIV